MLSGLIYSVRWLPNLPKSSMLSMQESMCQTDKPAFEFAPEDNDDPGIRTMQSEQNDSSTWLDMEYLLERNMVTREAIQDLQAALKNSSDSSSSVLTQTADIIPMPIESPLDQLGLQPTRQERVGPGPIPNALLPNQESQGSWRKQKENVMRKSQKIDQNLPEALSLITQRVSTSCSTSGEKTSKPMKESPLSEQEEWDSQPCLSILTELKVTPAHMHAENASLSDDEVTSQSTKAAILAPKAHQLLEPAWRPEIVQAGIYDEVELDEQLASPPSAMVRSVLRQDVTVSDQMIYLEEARTLIRLSVAPEPQNGVDSQPKSYHD